jgi:hypothetical protein
VPLGRGFTSYRLEPWEVSELEGGVFERSTSLPASAG